MLSTLLRVLIALVGYSSGVVIVGRRRMKPIFADLLAIIGVWIIVLGVVETPGRIKRVAIALIVGLAAGALMAVLRRLAGQADDGQRDLRRQPEVPGRGLRAGWKRFAAALGEYQSRMLLAFFYFVLITPFGLWYGAVADPLRRRRRGASTYWVTRRPDESSIDAVQRQF